MIPTKEAIKSMSREELGNKFEKILQALCDFYLTDEEIAAITKETRDLLPTDEELEKEWGECKDMEALFRRASEYWYRKGGIETQEETMKGYSNIAKQVLEEL